MPCSVVSLRRIRLEEAARTGTLIPAVCVRVRRQCSCDGVAIRVVNCPNFALYIAWDEQQEEKSRRRWHARCCKTKW